MKKLFLSSLLLLFLFSSCSTIKKDELPSYKLGYELSGLDAAEYYLSLLKENECPEFRYNYVYSLFEGEDVENALKEVIIAEEMYPDYIRFCKLESFMYAILCDSEGSISSLEKCLKLDPFDKETNRKLLEELEIIEDKERVKEVALNILKFDNKNKDALRSLSKIDENYKILYDALK